MNDDRPIHPVDAAQAAARAYGGRGDSLETFNVAETDTQGYVARIDGRPVIAFRGTTNVSDWRRNAKVIKVDFDPDNGGAGRVHRGFRAAAASALGDVLVQLAAHSPDPTESVNVIGHSLAGPLAIFTGLWLQQYDARRPVHATVFGCPRPGDAAFAAWVDSKLAVDSWVLGQDPVTWIPKWGYEPVGARHHLGSKWRRSQIRRLLPGRWGGPFGLWAGDHGIDEYIDALLERFTV